MSGDEQHCGERYERFGTMRGERGRESDGIETGCMLLQDALPGEREEINRLFREFPSYRESVDPVGEILGNPYSRVVAAFVARDEESIVGTYLATLKRTFHSTPSDSRLSVIEYSHAVVDPRYRRRGIATALTGEMLHRAHPFILRRCYQMDEDALVSATLGMDEGITAKMVRKELKHPAFYCETSQDNGSVSEGGVRRYLVGRSMRYRLMREAPDFWWLPYGDVPEAITCYFGEIAMGVSPTSDGSAETYLRVSLGTQLHKKWERGEGHWWVPQRKTMTTTVLLRARSLEEARGHYRALRSDFEERDIPFDPSRESHGEFPYINISRTGAGAPLEFAGYQGWLLQHCSELEAEKRIIASPPMIRSAFVLQPPARHDTI